MANYPTAVSSFTTKNSADTIQAAHVNDLQTEVTAIENALLNGQAHHVYPTITNAYDLGTSTLGWRNLYLAGDAIIGATKKVRLDGSATGNTYIVEGSADILQIFAGGSLSMEFQAASVNIQPTDRFYLDGGGNTYIVEGSADLMQFFVGAVNPLQIDTTGVIVTSGKKLYLDGGANTYIIENSADVLRCVAGGAGGVDLTSGATSWAAVSDERLKVLIEPIANAVHKLGCVRAMIGRYRTDPPDSRRAFLLAQDFQAALPEAVDVDADGTLRLRYTEVIPLLVAGIRELTQRLERVEVRG